MKVGRDKRDRQVRVRLVPSTVGHAILVRFTDEEYAACTGAAKAMGIGSLSAFLRGVGIAAGAKHHARAQEQAEEVLHAAFVIAAAADDAHMAVNEWLRVVALSAIGYTELSEHLILAGRALKEGLTIGGYED